MFSVNFATTIHHLFRKGHVSEPFWQVDNPQVQVIIVAISKGGSDKHGVTNPQETKGKINILSSPICHSYDSTYTECLLPTTNEK